VTLSFCNQRGKDQRPKAQLGIVVLYVLSNKVYNFKNNKFSESNIFTTLVIGLVSNKSDGIDEPQVKMMLLK
jgi:hypothetical protein